METTLREADSLLAIDIGDITTRAVLFDSVEGRYRFLAIGSSPTTAVAPYQDVREGVRLALARLQEVTGRRLISDDFRLLVPEQENGSGIATVTVTLSAGAPLRIVIMGLLEEISVESARQLAATTYAGIVDTISMNDRRNPESRLDALLSARPDVIILAGGIEGGASHSVLQFVDTVRLACRLLPNEQRPVVLYAGNQALVEEVKTALGSLTDVRITSNIRPAQEVESLEPAQVQLANIYRSIRLRQLGGVAELDARHRAALMYEICEARELRHERIVPDAQVAHGAAAAALDFGRLEDHQSRAARRVASRVHDVPVSGKTLHRGILVHGRDHHAVLERELADA